MFRQFTTVLVALFVSMAICIAFAADAGKAVDVTGKVVDKAGQPIANCEVVLFYLDAMKTESSKTIANVKSSADGTFSFPASITWPISPSRQPARYYIIANNVANGIGYTAVAPDDKTSALTIHVNGKQSTKVTVTAPDGKPLAGATVYLTNSSPKVPSGDYAHSVLTLFEKTQLNPATTDAAGIAEVVVPADSVCRFVASKPGYAKSYGAPETLDSIKLLPGGTVSGNITFSDGKPAPNVRVTYSYVSERMGHADSAVTDDKGHYELKDVGIPAANTNADSDPFAGAGGTLSAQDDSLDIPSTVSTNVTAKANETVTKDLVLEKNLELSGVVVDAATNKPLPGISFYIQTYGGRGMSSGRMLVSDDQGHFRTGVPRGGANVQFNLNAGNNSKYLIDEQQQMNSGQMNLQGLSADKKDVKLRVYLIPTHTVNGKVSDPAGGPLAGISIYSDQRLPAILTKEDGSFSIANAPADRPFAILAITTGRGAVAPVKPEQTEVTLQLQPTVERELVAATKAGKAVSDLAVSAYPTLNQTYWYQANVGGGQTDASGKLRLKNLVPGVTYQINWNSNSGKGPYGMGNMRAEISAKSEEPIRCNVRTFTNTLTGKVVNAKDEPVAGAQFEFRSQQVFNQQNMGSYYNTRTGPDGSFKFENLADGTLDIGIYAPSYRRMHVAIPTNKTDAKVVVHTQQEPAQHIVTVYDEAGKPIPDAMLMLSFRDRSNGQTGQDTIKTDENGVADLSDLPADDISVVCDMDEYALAAITMQSYEEGQYSMTLTKAMPPRQVRVVGDDGKPIADLQLRVSSFSAPSQDGNYGNNMAQLYNWPQDLLKSTGMIQKTDAQGRAVFPKVSHNQYVSLQIQSQTYGNQSKDLQVSQSDTVSEIHVSVPGSVNGKLSVKGNAMLDFSKYNVQLRPHQSGQYHSGQVRPDGSYSIANVVPGEYSAMVSSYGRDAVGGKYKLRGDHAITVEPTKAVKLDLELQEGIKVRGKLEYDKQKSPGRAQIALMTPQEGMLNPSDVAADGTFEAYVAGPGTYMVYYLLPGTNSWDNSTSITVPEDKPLEDVVIKAKPR